MAWGNLGTTTLSSTGSPVTVSGYTASEFSQELHHGIEFGSYGSSLRFNNDSGSVYANGRSANGAAKNNSVNRTFIENVYGDDTLMISYIVDIASEEKLVINFGVFAGVDGASNAPNRLMLVGKYVPSPTARITEVNRFDSEGGAHGIGTNLTVLGSDVTPVAEVPAIGTDIQDNTLFVEKENARRYWFDGTNWTMQSTFEDDFTTDKGWVSSGAQAQIDTSNGYLLYDEDSDGNLHKIYYDIGRTLDDTKWLWRFKITTNTFTMNSDPTPQIVYIRISDNTDHRDSCNNEDAIGFSYRTSDGNQKYIRTTYSDGAVFGTNSNFSTQIATGTHYVQITRDSSTQFTVSLYSDSSYSTLVESNSVTIPSTITGLRYLKIDNMDSDGTSNGRLIFHIDDMELYSGVTSKN